VFHVITLSLITRFGPDGQLGIMWALLSSAASSAQHASSASSVQHAVLDLHVMTWHLQEVHTLKDN
jgi:hypothetical protein